MSEPTPDYLDGMRWIVDGDELGDGPLLIWADRTWDSVCFECGAEEGELHKLGCEFELCLWCGNLTANCDHCYADEVHFTKRFLANRVPFIRTPSICPRCGLLLPNMFMVEPATWAKYVPPYLRKEHLCFGCYCEIARWTQAALNPGGQP